MTIALAGVLLAFSGGIFVADADGFESGMMVGAHGGCRSEGAAIAIAEADAKSQVEAEFAFQMYVKLGECGQFPRPLITEVVSVILDYKDYEGTPTQVIEVKSGDKTFYMIALKSLAEDAPMKGTRL